MSRLQEEKRLGVRHMLCTTARPLVRVPGYTLQMQAGNVGIVRHACDVACVTHACNIDGVVHVMLFVSGMHVTLIGCWLLVLSHALLRMLFLATWPLVQVHNKVHDLGISRGALSRYLAPVVQIQQQGSMERAATVHAFNAAAVLHLRRAVQRNWRTELHHMPPAQQLHLVCLMRT